MPTISVIVPVYKVEKYIHRCVDSILGQTFTDFELILVDDGSPDHCGTICDEYAAKDSRVVVIHQENGGLSAARNAGIDWAFANSDSQWLSFIDSDDWIHPEYLQRLLDAAVENNVAVSISGYAQTDGAEPEIDPNLLPPVLWNTEEFFVKHNVNATIACGKLYRKECFQTIRYPVGKIHEDEFTTYKVLFWYEQVAVIPAALYSYYINLDGIIHRPWSLEKMDMYAALEAQIAFFADRGYESAKRNVIRRYLKNISDRIAEFSQEADRYQDLLPMLKEKRKKNFRKFAQQLDVNDNADAWVLTKVFPIRMQMYWYWRALVRKIQHKQ